jgi:hypothetical protein
MKHTLHSNHKAIQWFVPWNEIVKTCLHRQLRYFSSSTHLSHETSSAPVNSPDPSEPSVLHPYYLGRQEQGNMDKWITYVVFRYNVFEDSNLRAFAENVVKNQTLKNKRSPQIKSMVLIWGLLRDALSVCLVGRMIGNVMGRSLIWCRFIWAQSETGPFFRGIFPSNAGRRRP